VLTEHRFRESKVRMCFSDEPVIGHPLYQLIDSISFWKFRWFEPRTPVWDGCRKLEAGEWFTYAPRIWNSFDGRYYGPVREANMVGVFRPVWTSDN